MLCPSTQSIWHAEGCSQQVDSDHGTTTDHSVPNHTLCIITFCEDNSNVDLILPPHAVSGTETTQHRVTVRCNSPTVARTYLFLIFTRRRQPAGTPPPRPSNPPPSPTRCLLQPIRRMSARRMDTCSWWQQTRVMHRLHKGEPLSAGLQRSPPGQAFLLHVVASKGLTTSR